MQELFTARPAPDRRRLVLIVAFVTFFTLWHTVGSMFGASATTTATISGTAFQDLNHDGVQQPDEEPFADHVIYLFDESGAFVASRTTDAQGRYAFADQPTGTYEVAYMRTSWEEVWSDWAPTTTDGVFPEMRVTLDGAAVAADFGWRPIEWSTDLDAPITEVVGDQGLVVQSYNDAVTAQQVYDYIVDNLLVGAEASTTRVRFAYKSLNRASTQVKQSDGVITHVQTTAYASYERMLRRRSFQTVAHEYGHAWTAYHNYLVQQDVNDEWRAFLTARGIDPDDERLWSTRAWYPSEIAADDYRQLFSTEPTSTGRHMNGDIPDAWDVEGLEEWLRDVFTTPPGGTQGDTEEDTTDDGSNDTGVEEPASTEEEVVEDPDSEAEESGDSEAEEETSTTVEEPLIELAVDTSKVRGLNHADLSWNGDESADVEVYRDGNRLTTVSASAYTDDTIGRGSPTHTYRVCEAGTDVCSAAVEVRF